ncbi:hypothetical protein Lal_00027820 [Lupinus albus]|nr:hypothetical protein Lal_00027820 [Lupinus albus]
MRRTILNFLVNSPKGIVFLKSIDASHFSKTTDKVFGMMDEIVEEVGEENVVQIVTDNAINYKAARELLMRKRMKLYQTPCAAQCIDLMLEDIEKKIPIHKKTTEHGKKITTYIYSRTSLISLLHYHNKGTYLITPVATHFATSYLILGCLVDNKQALIRIVLEQHCGLLINLSKCFDWWIHMRSLSWASFMKQWTKLKRMMLKRVIFQYGKSLIKDRTSNYIGLYMLQATTLTKNYTMILILKLVLKLKGGCMIDDGVKNKSKFFGSLIAMAGVKTKTSSQWWESYGDEHRELQNFIIRVLSLTCSSSDCEGNWSAFEIVHTKRRNCLMQKTMNDVVYVMTNSKLEKKKKFKEVNEYNMDDIDSNDDWIVENKENSDMDASNDEEFFQVGQNAYVNDVTGASLEYIGNPNLDHLDIPNFDNNGDEDVMDKNDY